MADTIDLSSNPFVPPANGRCLINELPSELLSHIFTLGWTPERDLQLDSHYGSHSNLTSTSRIARAPASGIFIDTPNHSDASTSLRFQLALSF
ncbi:hypothetical protein NUW54_g757 [Trametes sanguinea]|uniref:Uncharacterized protein n=1 Tax=Trametes sanguinea TaxID=158606 RepID=A0ACC1QBE1_9APHY|nr:hypothetical protein NUW54_g757 [Trametes sanguinea]